MECAPKVRFATDSRWRKQNSNHRSPSRGCRLILGEEKGPAVDQIVSKDAVLFTGDQWFESVSLHRGVSNELGARTYVARSSAWRARCLLRESRRAGRGSTAPGYRRRRSEPAKC